MLREYGIPEPVGHAPNCQRHTAEKQNASSGVHDAPPFACRETASTAPLCRKIPIHMANKAMITSNPPRSAAAPAKRPYLRSSNTKTGRATDPAKRVSSQRYFHFSRI